MYSVEEMPHGPSRLFVTHHLVPSLLETIKEAIVEAFLQMRKRLESAETVHENDRSTFRVDEWRTEDGAVVEGFLENAT